MEEKYEDWLHCEHCDGEFRVDTEVSMAIIYCCFCGEPLEDVDFESDLPLDEPIEI